jgi:hypothetical protein
MGADSIFAGNAGSAITIGTNGRIMGRAIAQTAVTRETHCAIETTDATVLLQVLSPVLRHSSPTRYLAVLELVQVPRLPPSTDPTQASLRGVAPPALLSFEPSASPSAEPSFAECLPSVDLAPTLALPVPLPVLHLVPPK